MKELIFVTNNQHKLREIAEIAGANFRIISLKELGFLDEIDEVADTIEGNATLKSMTIWSLYHRDCFADDTGLEIDALGGNPGVKSARYAGEDCIAQNNINKVLNEMKGMANRKARFKTVISLITGGQELLFTGVVEGTILDDPRGESGFGYDPIFRPDGYDQSFAEMDAALKNKISHRGRATEKLIDYLLHSALSR